jgi:YD repeat-containing protein
MAFQEFKVLVMSFFISGAKLESVSTTVTVTSISFIFWIQINPSLPVLSGILKESLVMLDSSVQDGLRERKINHDFASRLLTLNNNNAQLSYAYTDANELLSETSLVVGQVTPLAVGYSYDVDGNRATMTNPDGSVVSYTYTARNQLSSESVGGAAIVSYQYNLNGNRLTKTLGNNTRTAYSYDTASRLTSLVHSNAAQASLLARFDYALNAVGNRTSKTETMGQTSPLVLSENYAYDAI